ncbi:hypothetical protein BH23GEM3_BH23GEM3_05680 [soil metagenome]
MALEAVRNHEEYQQTHRHISLEEDWEQTGRSKRFIRRNESGSGKNLGVAH